MSAVISAVVKNSPAERYGLKAGEVIDRINGIEIKDYLDYMYASSGEELRIELAGREVYIENYDYEPLGIEFETLLIDRQRSCHNKCIFCFIDQLPKGMRSSCYFKDDDYRLSFLQGNYVSMTNMKDEDVERIIKYNIPRINISVHTTNPELRVKMLNNKRAGEVLGYIKRFADGGMFMDMQIVLCPGINDGAELERTLSDLSKLSGSIESISVVPVGLSKHRQGLYELERYNKETAGEVVDIIEKWQSRFKAELGRELAFAGDEFYIMAEREFPGYDEYQGFPQLENGVGMCASLIYEFGEALEAEKNKRPKRRKTIATGKIAYDMISSLMGRLDGDMIDVYAVENDFFGHNITVTGLITGGDIINQLKGRDLGEQLLISESALRRGEDVFLDNTTVGDVEKALGVEVRVVPNDGYELLAAALG
ncbi:MAG TPA: DUF512 domain-containing protein [Firmicutes bacterium]|nr:DUF512 domain-containing protein [Bacillota bacterium]